MKSWDGSERLGDGDGSHRHAVERWERWEWWEWWEWAVVGKDHAQVWWWWTSIDTENDAEELERSKNFGVGDRLCFGND
jgi:hypothetical protein